MPPWSSSSTANGLNHRPWDTTCIKIDGTLTKLPDAFRGAHGKKSGGKEKAEEAGRSHDAEEQWQLHHIDALGHPLPARHLPDGITGPPVSRSRQFRMQAVKDVAPRQLEPLDSFIMGEKWFHENVAQDEDEEVLITELNEIHEEGKDGKVLAKRKKHGKGDFSENFGKKKAQLSSAKKAQGEISNDEDPLDDDSVFDEPSDDDDAVVEESYMKKDADKTVLDLDGRPRSPGGKESKNEAGARKLQTKPADRVQGIMKRRRNAIRTALRKRFTKDETKGKDHLASLNSLDADIRSFEEKAALLAFYVGVAESAKSALAICRPYTHWTEGLSYKQSVLAITECTAVENIQKIAEKDIEDHCVQLVEACQPLVDLFRKSNLLEKTELEDIAHAIIDDTGKVQQARESYDNSLLSHDRWVSRIKHRIQESLKIAAVEFINTRQQIEVMKEAISEHKGNYEEFSKKSMDLQRRHKLMADKLQDIADAEAEREQARSTALKKLHAEKEKNGKTMENLTRMNAEAEKETVGLTSRVCALVEEKLVACTTRMLSLRKERQGRATEHLRRELESKKAFLEKKNARLRAKIAERRAELMKSQEKDEILNIFCLGTWNNSVLLEFKSRTAQLPKDEKEGKRGSHGKKRSSKGDESAGLLDDLRTEIKGVSQWLQSRGHQFEVDIKALTVTCPSHFRMPMTMAWKVQECQRRFEAAMQALRRQSAIRDDNLRRQSSMRDARKSRRKTRNSYSDADDASQSLGYGRLSVITSSHEDGEEVVEGDEENKAAPRKSKKLASKALLKLQTAATIVKLGSKFSRLSKGDGERSQSKRRTSKRASKRSSMESGTGSSTTSKGTGSSTTSSKHKHSGESPTSTISREVTSLENASAVTSLEIASAVPDEKADESLVADQVQDATSDAAQDSAGDRTGDQIEKVGEDQAEGVGEGSSKLRQNKRATLDFVPDVQTFESTTPTSQNIEESHEEEDDGENYEDEESESELSEDENSDESSLCSDYEPDLDLQYAILNGLEPEESAESVSRITSVPDILNTDLNATEETIINVDSRWTNWSYLMGAQAMCEAMGVLKMQIESLLEDMKSTNDFAQACIYWTEGSPARAAAVFGDVIPRSLAFLVELVSEAANRGKMLSEIVNDLEALSPNVDADELSAACEAKLFEVSHLDLLLDDEFLQEGYQWLRRLFKALAGRVHLRHACLDAFSWYCAAEADEMVSAQQVLDGVGEVHRFVSAPQLRLTGRWPKNLASQCLGAELDIEIFSFVERQLGEDQDILNCALLSCDAMDDATSGADIGRIYAPADEDVRGMSEEANSEDGEKGGSRLSHGYSPVSPDAEGELITNEDVSRQLLSRASSRLSRASSRNTLDVQFTEVPKQITPTHAPKAKKRVKKKKGSEEARREASSRSSTDSAMSRNQSAMSRNSFGSASLGKAPTLARTMDDIQAALKQFTSGNEATIDTSDVGGSQEHQEQQKQSKADGFERSMTTRKTDLKTAARLVRSMVNSMKKREAESMTVQSEAGPRKRANSTIGFKEPVPGQPPRCTTIGFSESSRELVVDQPPRCTSVEILDLESPEREVLRDTYTKAGTVMLQRGKTVDGASAADMLFFALQCPEQFQEFLDDGRSDGGSDDLRGARQSDDLGGVDDLDSRRVSKESSYEWVEEGVEEELGQDEYANIDSAEQSPRSHKGEIGSQKEDLPQDETTRNEASRDLDLSMYVNDSPEAIDLQDNVDVRFDKDAEDFKPRKSKRQTFAENQIDSDTGLSDQRRSVAAYNTRRSRGSMLNADMKQHLRETQKKKKMSFKDAELARKSVTCFFEGRDSYEDGPILQRHKTVEGAEHRLLLESLDDDMVELAEAVLKSMGSDSEHLKLDYETVKAANEFFGLRSEGRSTIKATQEANEEDELLESRLLTSLMSGFASKSPGKVRKARLTETKSRTLVEFSKKNVELNVVGHHYEDHGTQNEVELDDIGGPAPVEGDSSSSVWTKDRISIKADRLSRILKEHLPYDHGALCHAGSPDSDGKAILDEMRQVQGSQASSDDDTKSPRVLQQPLEAGEGGEDQDPQEMQKCPSGIWLNEENRLLAEIEGTLSEKIPPRRHVPGSKLQDCPSGVWLKPDGKLRLLQQVGQLLMKDSPQTAKDIVANVDSSPALADRTVGPSRSNLTFACGKDHSERVGAVYALCFLARQMMIMQEQPQKLGQLMKSSASDKVLGRRRRRSQKQPATQKVKRELKQELPDSEVEPAPESDSQGSRNEPSDSEAMPESQKVPGSDSAEAMPESQKVPGSDSDSSPSHSDSEKAPTDSEAGDVASSVKASTEPAEDDQVGMLHSDSSKQVLSMLSPNSSLTNVNSSKMLYSDSSKILASSLSTCSSRTHIEKEPKKLLPLKQWKLPKSLRINSPEPVMDNQSIAKGSGQEGKGRSGIVQGTGTGSNIKAMAESSLFTPLVPWLSQIKSRKNDIKEKWDKSLASVDDSANWSPRKQEHEILMPRGGEPGLARKLPKEPPMRQVGSNSEVEKRPVAWISPLRRRVLGQPCIQVGSTGGFDDPLPRQDRGVLACNADRAWLPPTEHAPYRHGYQRTATTHTRKQPEVPHSSRFVQMTAKDNAALRRRRPLYGSSKTDA